MSSSNFVDFVRVFCASGNGGKGSTHLHREKFVAKGGPDGGNGGHACHIRLSGLSQYLTLLHLRYRTHIRATPGGAGSGALCTGADGENIIVDVPLGTVAKVADTGEYLFEITKEGEEKILVKGGRGGMGNAFFKSATHQTPRFSQPGEPGEENWFILELKLLADVGLVGFPNAGKSTLLSVMSSARPKIADYAFTTLEPSLGIVECRDQKSFVMADIPGIIEGAHSGKGLGLRFLKHIERNSMLLFLIPADAKSIKDEYKILLNELKQYNPELLTKDRILAISKSDLLDEELEKEIKKTLPRKVPHIFISSVANKGLTQLKDLLWDTLNS